MLLAAKNARHEPPMIFVWVGLLFGLMSTVCWAFIVLHAFRRSVGTGVMVLFVPCFIFYYAFGQFEHPRKGVLVAGFIGGLLLSLTLPMLGSGGPVATLITPRAPARTF